MKTTTVQMRLPRQTLNEVEYIKKVTGANRTRIALAGVKVLSVLSDEITSGNTVWVIDKFGNRKQIMMVF